MRTQIDKLTSSLKQRDEEVRGLKAEVRVARRAEKAHAQTLAERAEQANQHSGAMVAASSSSSSTSGGGSGASNGSGSGHDPVAVAALTEEKLQLQDLVFDLEVKLEEANDKVATMKREATAQVESHQRALQAARQEVGSGEIGSRNSRSGQEGAASSQYTTSSGLGSGEGGAADEASEMPLGFRGAFLADKAAQVCA